MTSIFSQMIAIAMILTLTCLSCNELHPADTETYSPNICNVFWWNSPPYAYKKTDDRRQQPTPTTNNNSKSESTKIMINPNDSVVFGGIILSVLAEIQEQCLHHLMEPKPGASDNECLWRYREVKNQLELRSYISSSNSNPGFYAPYTKRAVTADISGHALEDEYWFMPLVESPGVVQFFRAEMEPMASDLTDVARQAWPLVIMILLGAAYSGIIIWLLDRLWNPTNFPKPFIRGFWEGFWWAFVTMTTVGYGDTTPRSIQARIYGLVWIVIGITILSVFTATVTTVLTQSIIAHPIIQGIKVGVLNGSEEYRLAISLGAESVVANTFLELLHNMELGITGAAIVDQYIFAINQHHLGDDYLIAQMREYPVSHGMLIKGSTPGLRACVAAYSLEHRLANELKLSDHIPHLYTRTIGSLNGNQELFRPETIIYLFYGLAVWVIIFIAFVIWQFACWNPKHLKRKELKRKLEEQNPTIDAEEGQCKGTVPSNITLFTRPKSSLTKMNHTKTKGQQHNVDMEAIKCVMRLPEEQEVNGDTQVQTDPQNNTSKDPALHFTYENDAYLCTEEQNRKVLPLEVNSNSCPRPEKSPIEVVQAATSSGDINTYKSPLPSPLWPSCLQTSLPSEDKRMTHQHKNFQSLMANQMSDIQQCETEFMNFRRGWVKNLKVTKQLHKQQQKDYALNVKNNNNGDMSFEQSSGVITNIYNGGALPVDSSIS